MAARRTIDIRDVDRLLSALSDVQIANVFDMPVGEVFELRQSRRIAFRPSQDEVPLRDGKSI